MAEEEHDENNSNQESQAESRDVDSQSKEEGSDMEDQDNSKNASPEVLTWKSREFIPNRSSLGSSWLFWLAWVIMAGFAFWQNQWLFLSVVIAVGIFWFLLRSSSKEKVKVRVSEEKVEAGDRSWEMDNFMSFWVNEDVSPARLHLDHSNPVIPDLVFTLEDVNIEQLREILSVIPEKEEPDWMDRISGWLGLE